MEDPRYHIRIDDPEKVGKYVLLPGDRGRVKELQSIWKMQRSLETTENILQ